jgi:DNA-directed RNA polymerase specialized sigma24 family protein
MNNQLDRKRASVRHPIQAYNKAAWKLANKLVRAYRCPELLRDLHQEALITFWNIYIHRNTHFGNLSYMMRAGYLRGADFILHERDPLGRTRGKQEAEAVTLDELQNVSVAPTAFDKTLAQELMRKAVPNMDLLVRTSIYEEQQKEVAKDLRRSRSSVCRAIQRACDELRKAG